MDRTVVIEIGKMIEMLIPLVMLIAALVLSQTAQTRNKAPCRIPVYVRTRKTPNNNP